MADRDFYRALGVARSASDDEIKKAYRTLAKELHPDRNPGDEKAEARFKEVSEAYNVLSDKKKKSLYDEFGEMGLRDGFDADAFRAQQAFRGGGGGFDFSEMFGNRGGGGFGGGGFGFDINDILGGQQRRRGAGPKKGGDFEAEVSIAFLDAFTSVQKEITYSDPRSGESQSLKVRIPKGIRDGEKLRLKGKGGSGRGGGPRGDLLLTVKVKSHPSLWFEGEDLHMNLPVSPLQAYEGQKVKIPTPAGEGSVRLPSGAQPGAKLRLRRKGAPRRKGSPTDLIVHLQMRLPKEVDEKVLKALQTIDEAFGEDELREDLPVFEVPED